MFAWHVLSVSAAYLGAFHLRFEWDIPPEFGGVVVPSLLLLLAVRLPMFSIAGLGRGLWRYTGITDLQKILFSATAGSAVFGVLVMWVIGLNPYPRSVLVIEWLLTVCLSGGVRLAMRWARSRRPQQGRGGKKTLIVGAGKAGELIVRDMKNDPSCTYDPIGFVGFDVNQKGLTIHGVPILGTRPDLPGIMRKHRPEEVILAMPKARPGVIRGIMEELSEYKAGIKTLPSLDDVMEGRVSVRQIRKLNLEDLLLRPPVPADTTRLTGFIRGKAVMVTGAGGSIGSEICRQVASHGARAVIAYEWHENSLYNLEMDLRGRMPGVPLRPVVGDIGSVQRLSETLESFMPDIIFHAAAHKHVPMMELNPGEAVRNNVIGTSRLARAAAAYGVETFVFISTDKAVNPSSVMGATKRACELMLGAYGRGTSTRFITVRFGNVLGSSGSVVPLFKKQIDAGGPVTVTHPEIERYLMLISEAVQLVLQAASIGEGGETFVLDMGEPIKMDDLARNLIMLSGYEPEKDIEIKYIGLRPGEKLYEELFDSSETVSRTAAEKVLRAVTEGAADAAMAGRISDEFERLLAKGDTQGVMGLLAEFVKTYNPAPDALGGAAPDMRRGRGLYIPRRDGQTRGRPARGAYSLRRRAS